VKARNNFSGSCPNKDNSKIRIQTVPLMRNTLRPKYREAAPCQDALKAFLLERGMAGLFLHIQLSKHLNRAGFAVRQIERENNHADVWVLTLRRGDVTMGREIEWCKKQVCLFLKRYGLRYPKREVVVMVQGDRIKAAFNWAPGSPGWLVLQRTTHHGTQTLLPLMRRRKDCAD
jgi:hypothetical protein